MGTDGNFLPRDIHAAIERESIGLRDGPWPVVHVQRAWPTCFPTILSAD